MATALQWSGGERCGRKEAQVLVGKDIRLIIWIKLDGVYTCLIFVLWGKSLRELLLGNDEYGRGFKLKKKKKSFLLKILGR